MQVGIFSLEMMDEITMIPSGRTLWPRWLGNLIISTWNCTPKSLWTNEILPIVQLSRLAHAKKLVKQPANMPEHQRPSATGAPSVVPLGQNWNLALAQYRLRKAHKVSEHGKLVIGGIWGKLVFFSFLWFPNYVEKIPERPKHVIKSQSKLQDHKAISPSAFQWSSLPRFVQLVPRWLPPSYSSQSIP